MTTSPSSSAGSSFSDTLTPAKRGTTIQEIKVGLTTAQRALRKERYARQGFVPPGITWRDVLLSDAADQEIAAELALPFETREIPLADEAQAKLWILERILENPCLNAFQRIRANLQHKALLLEQGREHMAAGRQGLTEMSNPPVPHNTRAQIAKASGSSQGQVHKVETLLEHAPPALLQELEAGTLKIGAAFEALRAPPPSETETPHYGVLYVDAAADMDAKRLRALPIRGLATEDAALFCRVHPCDLVKVLGCLRGWGFAYQTHLVVPLNRPSICEYAQEHHDLLLLALQGKPTTPAVEECPSSLLSPKASDDQSREAIFQVMEQLFPQSTRVQVGSGLVRPGWVACDPCHSTHSFAG